MKIHFTARHFDSTEGLQERMKEEIDNLARFYERITSCNVILDAENKNRQIAEITIGIQGKTLVAKAQAEHMGKAIESVLDKMGRQLKKQNEKIHEHRAKKVKEKPGKEDEEEFDA